MSRISVALVVLVAMVAVSAQPWKYDGHQSGGSDSSTKSPSVSVTPDMGGSGGASGSGGVCWGSGGCRDTCKRIGFADGYCFFFRCYCRNETTPPPKKD